MSSKKRECPSCAMIVDAGLKECPICGHEFANFTRSQKIVAALLIVLFILFFIF